MKKLIVLALAALVALSCSKDDGVGSYSISGTPEITSLEVGYKRVIATWSINTTMDDAALTNIYWSGGDNSTGQYLTSDTGNSITIEITDLAEGEYTFYAQNATPTSNKYSAPSPSVTVYVYGETYCSALAQRSIVSTELIEGDDNGVGQRIDVTWGTAPSSSDCIGSSLNYYNRAGDLTSKFCSLSESVSELEDALVGTEFTASTLYLPAGCIDTLASTSTDSEDLPMGDGPILVGSLKAMQPYFEMDDVHIILDTGEYTIKASDVESGDLAAKAPTISTGDGGEAILVANGESSFFHIAGDNSTYDFGGSVITVYTSTYQYLNGNCTPLRFTGSGNTVKNLELIDSGDLESTGTNITNVIIDGADNLLTSFTLRSRGCTPYGYGELFGKGGVMILSTQKHCGVLIRGLRNTFSDSFVYHTAYGHCVFMQGAEYPTIDNCYIQSQVTTTEAVYAEKGSGSPADGADFLTYFGYHMSDNYNYTMALCEEGIRAYITGETVIDGIPYVTRAPVVSPTIKNCTIKDARGGVTLTHSSNAWVENCKAVGCGRGFAIPNSSTIKNCSSDAQYGPAYGVDYQGSGYTYVDITLIDQEGEDYITVVEPRRQWLSDPDEEFETCNGTAHIAYIEGSNQEVKIRDGRVKDTKDNSVKIKPSWATYPVSSISFAHIGLGGDDRNIGSLWLSDASVEILDENGDGTGEYGTANPSGTVYDDGSYLTNSKIANETDWPVWVDSETSGCQIWSDGVVIIEAGAKNNKIYIKGSKSDYVVEYGTMDSSNTIYENYTWDIDTCF